VLRAFVERELISESVAENMLSWPHSGFHVHLGPLIHEDEGEVLRATARYCVRAPLSLSRLAYDGEAGMVSYSYTNTYDQTEGTERITPLELIARLVLHIPDPRERVVRYFGTYANRSRGKRRMRGIVRGSQESEIEAAGGRTPALWKKKWAELLQLVFEVSLVCPRCGNEMKIISFITGAEPIEKILAHLKEKGIDARAGPFVDAVA
jgi:hypothetical protein